MQPVYFLPNVVKDTLCNPQGDLDRSILRARGLADIFADVTNYRVDCSICDVIGSGPGMKSGCVLAYNTPTGRCPRRIGFYPDEQTWHAIGDGEMVWIGTDNASPPTAADFARKTQHSGYRLTLADGAEWLVPIVRRPDGSTELPTDMYWDDAGRLQEPIKSAYAHLWETSAEVADWFTMAVEMKKARALEIAVQVLGINYRFGRNEQSVCRIIDSQTYLAILAASIDAARADAVEDAAKKNE